MRETGSERGGIERGEGGKRERGEKDKWKKRERTVHLNPFLHRRQEEGVELVVEVLPLHHAEGNALPFCVAVLIRLIRGVQVSHD